MISVVRALWGDYRSKGQAEGPAGGNGGLAGAAGAAELEAPDAQATREWADWIRQHADRTDPLNGPLHLAKVTSCSHEELQPHMNGWSVYGPYRS